MSEELEKAKDLEFYLSDHFLNLGLHQSLEDPLHLADPLKFFNLFYVLLGLIGSGKTLEAIRDVNSLNCGGLELFIILNLLERLGQDAEGIDAPNNTSLAAQHLLEKEYERLTKLFPPDMFLVNSPSLDERARAAVEIHKLSEQTVNKWIDELTKKAEERRDIELRARQSEREHLEQIFLPQIQSAIASAASKKNPEFTTNRQVLALCLMLKHLGVKNVDKTVQARFIEFLTGKTYKDIYDGVREVEEVIYKRDGKDAEYIKEWFQKLELPEIVKDIDIAIDKIRTNKEKL